MALVLAGAAGGVAVLAGRDAMGADAADRGETALNAALALPRGLDRDHKLDAAQTLLRQGLDYTPRDPHLWDLLAETRLMQATEASVETVSPELLAASAEASRQALALAPHEAAARARLAYVLSLEGAEQDAAAALAESYAAGPAGAREADRRIETAGRAWRALDEPSRQAALAETCARARDGEDARARLMALRMGPADPALALEIDRVLDDPACAPPLIPEARP